MTTILNNQSIANRLKKKLYDEDGNIDKDLCRFIIEAEKINHLSTLIVDELLNQDKNNGNLVFIKHKEKIKDDLYRG